MTAREMRKRVGGYIWLARRTQPPTHSPYFRTHLNVPTHIDILILRNDMKSVAPQICHIKYKCCFVLIG